MMNKENTINLDLTIANWKQRQLIKEITNLDHLKWIIKKKKKIYLGIDPTTDSLHLGHLVPIQLVKELAKLGCQPILLIGSATAQIGDPSFRKEKRTILTKTEISINREKIKKQLKKILPEALILDNEQWYQKLNLIDFLKNIGNQFSINKILEKKSLSEALTNQNLTYSQFSYLLLQAYDFYYLYQNYDCHLQIGGSDQFPNIVIGLALMRKKISFPLPVCGITTSLLVNNQGIKFSKTDKGNIWLDSSKTSFYQTYQFFYNLDDKNAQLWWSIFQPDKIENKKATFLQWKKRTLQEELFNHLLQLLVGKKKLAMFYQEMTIFKKNITLSEDNYQKLKEFLPNISISKKQFDLVTLLLATNLASSKREARTLIAQKAIKINNALFDDDDFKQLIEQKSYQQFILTKGKREVFLVKIVTEDS